MLLIFCTTSLTELSHAPDLPYSDHPMLPEILGDFSLDFLRLSVLESLEDRETRFFRSDVHGNGLANFIVG